MMNIKQVTITLVALIGIAGTSYGWIHANHTNHNLQSQLEETNHSINQKDQNLDNQNRQVQSQFQRTASDNADANISSVAVHNGRTEQASNDIKKFFQTYYSFSDSNEYNDRSRALLKQNLITESLAKDSNLFGNDKIISGLNYVDAIGLNSSFHAAYTFLPTINRDDHTLNLLTQVEYASNYNNQNAATTNMIYRVEYDLDTHKITRVQDESSLFNNTDSLNSLSLNGYFDNH